MQEFLGARALGRPVRKSWRGLREVNTSLCRDNHSEMFVTVFYGILDIRTGELHYSNGGHNPPCVLGRGSKPKVLDGETDGTVLGVMQDMS